MDKRPYKEIVTMNKYTLIVYEKGLHTEYCVALNFNPTEFEWDSGHYFYSLESALAGFLALINSKYVKSKNQIRIEEEYGITFDRMVEFADRCAWGLVEDDKENAFEYFENELDMTEKEMEFFGLQKGEENYDD